MDEAEPNTIRIGRFEIGPSYANEPSKIGIYLAGDGEGGDFSRADFEAVIAQFYKDNF